MPRLNRLHQNPLPPLALPAGRVSYSISREAPAAMAGGGGMRALVTPGLLIPPPASPCRKSAIGVQTAVGVRLWLGSGPTPPQRPPGPL
jgi:hypothetical protein